MTHEMVRAELSARLDDEQSTELAVPVTEHLAGCAACRQWQQAAEQVTSRVRQAAGRTGPDRTEQLLAAIVADQAPRYRPRRVRWIRLEVRTGLAAVALGQFALIVPALLFGNAGGGTPVHASHELGAFNLALAVGFAVAAVRPALARGMLPLAGIAAAALTVLSLVDSALRYTTLTAEAPHLITLAGAVLLFVLARAARHDAGPPWSDGQEHLTRRPGRAVLKAAVTPDTHDKINGKVAGNVN
ncbi:MAG TPA: zf-HC2 domain-containing protein [Streptosporangiaceae bacterium]|nr:zf-HC2 domain-containing protein [Streptosporangiaceae bacterium]